MTDPTSGLLTFINDWGPLGLFVLITLTGYRGIWVWKREHDAARADRDWWRDVAVRALNLGEAAIVRRRDVDGPGT